MGACSELTPPILAKRGREFNERAFAPLRLTIELGEGLGDAQALSRSLWTRLSGVSSSALANEPNLDRGNCLPRASVHHHIEPPACCRAKGDLHEPAMQSHRFATLRNIVLDWRWSEVEKPSGR